MSDATGGGSGGNDAGDGNQSGSGQGAGDGPTLVERAVTAVSIVVTLLLFAAVLWQAAVAPTNQAPTATVVETAPAQDGGVRVSIVVANPSVAGFESVSVSVNCTDPPVELVYEHLPAGDRRTKQVRCPSWNRSTTVSVTSWTKL